VVRFLDLDLSALRPSETVVLHEDLSIFLGLPQSRAERVVWAKRLSCEPDALPQPHDLTEETVRQLQDDARGIVRWVAQANRRPGDDRLTDGHPWWVLRPEGRWGILCRWLPRDGMSDAAPLCTRVRDQWQLTLMLLFTAVGSKVVRIRDCSACQQFFYAEDKRQRFCSERCAKRETMRRLRARRPSPVA
jgi:hypothetical protein